MFQETDLALSFSWSNATRMTLNQKSTQAHWDQIYATKVSTELGWYEAQAEPSLGLIQSCSVSKDAHVLDVGSGTSTLISALLEEGYENITALDISPAAVSKAKSFLGDDLSKQVQWITKDITIDTDEIEISKVAIWHDRAVMHFLIDEENRAKYLFQLKQAILPGGYVIISAFALDGAAMCSGLDVMRYDSRMLSDFLGDSFRRIESFTYEYTMPSGDKRPFVYTRFQRQ